MSIEINNTTSALIQRKKVKVDNLNNLLAKIVKENPQASEEQILKLFTETLMKNRPLFGKLSNNDIRKIIANTNINLQTTASTPESVAVPSAQNFRANYLVQTPKMTKLERKLAKQNIEIDAVRPSEEVINSEKKAIEENIAKNTVQEEYANVKKQKQQKLSARMKNNTKNTKTVRNARYVTSQGKMTKNANKAYENILRIATGNLGKSAEESARVFEEHGLTQAEKLYKSAHQSAQVFEEHGVTQAEILVDKVEKAKAEAAEARRIAAESKAEADAEIRALRKKASSLNNELEKVKEEAAEASKKAAEEIKNVAKKYKRGIGIGAVIIAALAGLSFMKNDKTPVQKQEEVA